MHQGMGTRPNPVALAVPGANTARGGTAARASARAAKAKQSVGVCALESKGAHPADQGLGSRAKGKAAALPGHQARRPQTTPVLLRHGKGRGNVRIHQTKVEDGKAICLGKTQKGLGNAKQTRRGLRVPRPRLARRQHQGRPSGRAGSTQHHRTQSTHLNGIAQRSTRAVHLHHVQLLRGKTCQAEGTANGLLLGWTVRGRQGAAATVLVHGSGTQRS
mmetsp:Transcript_10407/g.63537  ORF Transcript_10407/g.63537 Transcript_10407/m.63537 type:complete len:218 (+) Transcript_10407:11818-12471(+)